MTNEDEILESVTGMLRNFQGREYSGDIDRQTLFFADLGFASIDAVVLGEMLEEKYNCKFAFHELLSELAESGAVDMEVGDMVAFLYKQLAVQNGG